MSCDHDFGNAQRLEHLLAELELLVDGVKCNTGFDDCGCWPCQIRAVLERAPRPVGSTEETQRLARKLAQAEQRVRDADRELAELRKLSEAFKKNSDAAHASCRRRRGST